MLVVSFCLVICFILVLIIWMLIISGSVRYSDYNGVSLNWVLVCEYVVMLLGLLFVVLVIRFVFSCCDSDVGCLDEVELDGGMNDFW